MEGQNSYFHSICKIRWYPFLVEIAFPKYRLTNHPHNHNGYDYENCIHRNLESSYFLLVLPKFWLYFSFLHLNLIYDNHLE